MSSHVPPRASLLGLPAELRLMVYAQLANETHTHYVYPLTEGGYQSPHLRIAYPCPYPDTQFPQLCTRPRFSGLHPTQDLCTRSSTTVRKVFPLRQTCRLIYAESRYVLGAEATSVSALAHNGSWMFFRLPGTLRRITLLEVPYNLVHIHPVISSLEHYASSLTGLQSVAVQSPVAYKRFVVKTRRAAGVFRPEMTWQNLKIVKKLDEVLKKRVMIVLDAWVCFKPGHKFYEGNGMRDEMAVIRCVLWPGEEDRKSSCEVRREQVVERGNVEGERKFVGEEWKWHWTGKGLAYGKQGN
ncbi:hypothetical protein CC86DRAFT_373509 [Ophiobolus disseminans]|uniref:Uncharacterized protein n=1 Tax=Ophiobolus disseminans TaxID=1469910 RepID=A0A6A6ZN72_9PLEO|nr:hypothetical protein CC86DRAFT_373509 [Ophiobolus disseminans]